MQQYECLFLEDIIANAFIEIIDKPEIEFKIPMDIVMKYGEKVAEELQSQNKKVAFCISRDATDEIKEKYSDYFTFIKNDTEVILNDNIEMSKLIKRFRTFLPFDQLLAYMNNDVVEQGLLKPLKQLNTKEYQKKL